LTKRIAVIEDDPDITRLLKYNLEKDGYKVTTASDGETGLKGVKKDKPDLVILDVMLPKMDGFEVCRLIRTESRVPVLFLTAKNEEVDRILGLEMGGDDYVTKPFSIREISARIKAILRRTSVDSSESQVVRAGTLQIDLERYEVKLKNNPITLSTKEFEFLKCLIEQKGKVLSREKLLELIWGVDRSIDIDTRTVDQHIARLRDKLGPEGARILTVKNVGYRLKLD
jgi:DNA-binding response OmpR family regulator